MASSHTHTHPSRPFPNWWCNRRMTAVTWFAEGTLSFSVMQAKPLAKLPVSDPSSASLTLEPCTTGNNEVCQGRRVAKSLLPQNLRHILRLSLVVSSFFFLVTR